MHATPKKNSQAHAHLPWMLLAQQCSQQWLQGGLKAHPSTSLNSTSWPLCKDYRSSCEYKSESLHHQQGRFPFSDISGMEVYAVRGQDKARQTQPQNPQPHPHAHLPCMLPAQWMHTYSSFFGVIASGPIMNSMSWPLCKHMRLLVEGAVAQTSLPTPICCVILSGHIWRETKAMHEHVNLTHITLKQKYFQLKACTLALDVACPTCTQWHLQTLFLARPQLQLQSKPLSQGEQGRTS